MIAGAWPDLGSMRLLSLRHSQFQPKDGEDPKYLLVIAGGVAAVGVLATLPRLKRCGEHSEMNGVGRGMLQCWERRRACR